VKAMRLNQSGQRDFARMVESMRLGQVAKKPQQILNDQYAVAQLTFELEVKEGGFKSRFEIGGHLAEVLQPFDRSLYIGDRGFWDWLALLWFDDLCPVKTDGTRQRPSAVANYLMSEDYKRRYRHAVFVTWQLVDLHGSDVEFLLFKEPSVRGELTEQFMARQFYLSCNGIVKAAKKLYWDEDTSKLKKGAGSKTHGSARRFVAWMQQLEVTYDLFSMTDQQLLDLIPAEFRRFTSR
jgi:hypothetical protein